MECPVDRKRKGDFSLEEMVGFELQNIEKVMKLEIDELSDGGNMKREESRTKNWALRDAEIHIFDFCFRIFLWGFNMEK